MNALHFSVPPLLHYIIGGHVLQAAGKKHVSRSNIKVFDLLFVKSGCLYIREDERNYEVSEGHALILRPDCSHYGMKDCETETEYYWIHFQTTGIWSVSENASPPFAPANLTALNPAFPVFSMNPFSLELPQFLHVRQPGKMAEVLEQLTKLNSVAHLRSSRFKQQMIFQEIVQLLASSLEQEKSGPSTVCAEAAAAYLREHYREEVTADKLGEQLNFHPVYVARCMKREYGLAPMDYLLRYRIEQGKLLLLQTDYSIAIIAELSGFNQAPYFSSCFLKIEGISPRKYRQMFAKAKQTDNENN